ncbi:MAG: NADP-dependent oxidoreductase [Pseudomonadota bacterium]
MTAHPSKDWTLSARPVGEPKPEDFALVDSEAADPKPGEIQVRNTWMSVDPYMRGRMMDRKSYVPPFQIGEVLQGGAVGVVEASNHPDFSAGDKVLSIAGWRSAWTAAPAAVMAEKLPPADLPDSAFLGIAGMPGLTAYSGILRIAALKEGDTVFVSGAAGAVGSAVVQIAKIKGCTVIGSAGGPEKAAYVKSIGADHAIDYREHRGWQALANAIYGAAPQGIDVYFDNVGGDHLTAAIEAARPFARFALCGAIEQYNNTEPAPGPHNLIQTVGKQLTLKGFIVSSHGDMRADFLRDVSTWIGSGQLKYEETVMEGIEKAPEAFLGLFKGSNTGKMLVKIG